MEAKRPKEEVKVFQTSLEQRTINTTLFTQPSFYMALGNMALMYVVHRFPSEFLPAKYMTMSYNGLRAPAMLTIPFCCISGLYFSISSTIAGSSVPLKGHLYGYIVSLCLGISFISLRRISFYYPLLGCMYLAFGGFHHYRRMMLYGDNAPIFNWSDFTEIRKERKRLKESQSIQ